MLKSMNCAPGAAFAAVIAARSEPAPESLLLITVSVLESLIDDFPAYTRPETGVIKPMVDIDG